MYTRGAFGRVARQKMLLLLFFLLSYFEDMTEAHDQWMRHAEYDLATAKDMLHASRHYYVLFCCQQAVEKAVKALYAKRRAEVPPRSHQLIRIAQETTLVLTEEQEDLLRELSSYYIQSRYPDEVDEIATEPNQEIAEDILRRSEEFMSWLRSIL